MSENEKTELFNAVKKIFDIFQKNTEDNNAEIDNNVLPERIDSVSGQCQSININELKQIIEQYVENLKKEISNNSNSEIINQLQSSINNKADAEQIEQIISDTIGNYLKEQFEGINTELEKKATSEQIENILTEINKKATCDQLSILPELAREKIITQKIDDALISVSENIIKPQFTNLNNLIGEKTVSEHAETIIQNILNVKNVCDKIPSLHDIEYSVSNNIKDNISEINLKIEALTQKIDEKQKNDDKQQTELNIIKDELQNANNTIAKMKQEHEDDLAKYSCLDEIIAVKEAMEAMDYEQSDYLKKLCGGSGLFAAISLGRDEGKLKQLWQFLRESAVKEAFGTSELNTYFDFCIKVYNSVHDEKDQLNILEIDIGSEYDMQRCIKTSSSPQYGGIGKIITKCYIRGNDVVYKAVVEVE